MISLRHLFIISLIVFTSACSITEQFSKSLSTAVLESNDPQVVQDALPAYLLLVDSMIINNPDDPSILLTGASLNNAYGIFLSDTNRQKQLADKALDYANRALCLYKEEICNLAQKNYQQLEILLNQLDTDDLTMLYTFGAAWASWIQAYNDDWNAIANIAQVKLIMSRVLQLDETFQNAGAHIYLGVLNSILPAALGGKPDSAKQHFESAIDISNHNHLMAKVLYAKHYARLIFDRELHDRLLTEVIQSKAAISGLTLTNTLAQQQAREYLRNSADYF